MSGPIVASLDRIDQLLRETVLPFWYPVLLAPDGAFSLHHDGAGRWLGPAPVALVSQARLVWVGSRLAASGIDADFFRAAAARGLQFLLDRMWDGLHGGFFWRVNPDGTVPERTDKHVYGQAFALLALCEWAATTGDAEATARAHALFALLETHAHDGRHGGYVECFARDWSPTPPEKTFGPIGLRAGLKGLNTHMHLMHAVGAYTALTNDPVARARLAELVLIASCTVQRKGVGAPTEPHGADWRPLRGRPDAEVSLGHMVELAWMVPRAAATAGIPPALVDDMAYAMALYAARFGIDEKKGGLFDNAPVRAPSERRTKTWWTQAEALAGFLDRWRATGDGELASAYLGTLGWIESSQADRVHGEWHHRIDADGTVVGRKADGWKCAYHQVRALLLCRELLGAAAPSR